MPPKAFLLNLIEHHSYPYSYHFKKTVLTEQLWWLVGHHWHMCSFQQPPFFYTIAWPDRLSVERKKKNERTRERRGKDRTAILSVSPCFLSPFTVWLALQKSASYFEVVGWAFHWPEWTEATDGDKSHHQTFVTMHQLSQKMIRWGKGRRRLARSFSLVRDKGHPASFLFPRTTRELKSKVTFSQGRELNSYILKVLITPMFHVFLFSTGGNNVWVFQWRY